MPKLELSAPLIYFLCNHSRFPAYQKILNESTNEVQVFENVADVIRECIMQPPSAILIDIQTGIRLGTTSIHPLDNMQVLWPILRCNIAKDGFAVAVSVNPPRREPLPKALEAINKNDPEWLNPAYNRKNLRVNVECRVRLREKESTVWYRGNCINISAGGFFVITYNPPTKDKLIEVEIHDLLKTPIYSEAIAIWSRNWEDGTKLPGAGIRFDSAKTNPALRQALAGDQFVSHFLDSI